jgi:hypothetical protein
MTTGLLLLGGLLMLAAAGAVRRWIGPRRDRGFAARGKKLSRYGWLLVHGGAWPFWEDALALWVV